MIIVIAIGKGGNILKVKHFDIRKIVEDNISKFFNIKDNENHHFGLVASFTARLLE